jgi:hypothetical protein
MSFGALRPARRILEETKVDHFLVITEMLPTRVAEPHSPRNGTARMTNHVLTAVGLPTVLTVGSQLADQSVAHHGGDDDPRASHQRDLGINSSHHIFTRHIGPATQATSVKFFDNLLLHGPVSVRRPWTDRSD